MSTQNWDKTDKIALAASVAAHVVLFGLLSIQLSRPEASIPPKPITVEILAETDVEATSPNPSNEMPAAMKAAEEGPVEDAPAATSLPEPTPVMPEPVPVEAEQLEPTPVPKVVPKPTPRKTPAKKAVERPKPKPQPKAQPKPAAKPKVTPKKVASKPAPKKSAPAKSSSKAATKSGSGSGKGNAVKPSGDLAGMVGAVGKNSGGQSTGSPGKPSAQVRQSITTSIGSQVQGPWGRCIVSGIDVENLITTVKFRLNRNGSLGGFGSVATSGQNESNKNQVARHQECAKKAVQQASPFTGLPPEHYDYWKNYEFKFRKR